MLHCFVNSLRCRGHFRCFSAMQSPRFLKNLKFDNRFLNELPVDKSKAPGSRRVRNACFSLVDISPVDNPKLVAHSPGALSLLDIKVEENQHKEGFNEELANYFSGNESLPGSESAAHCYCGHQFGFFSGQLGDGAAIYLGQMVNKQNEIWELQLKGAGKTPYSRHADGRKVLRSSIREFLCSEAMHYLGIPTTRAGTVITSETKVVRDMFYDGRAKLEPCAVVLRIAPTFLRFGSFEIFKPTDPHTGRDGPSNGNVELLHKMLDYTISLYYPQIQERFSDKTERYLELYREVCLRTADLVAKWQCVGFCHGVLNTDNMSILGITIDYGPFGFMDSFDPNFICNSSDENGRYTYAKQPEICHWNLLKFAEAIKEAVPLSKTKEILRENYNKRFQQSYLTGMRKKLGLSNPLPDDKHLFEQLFTTMEETRSDFTNCFRSLILLPHPEASEFIRCRKEAEQALIACSPSFEDAVKMMKPEFDIEQLENFRLVIQQNPEVSRMMGSEDGPLAREMKKLDRYTKFQKLNGEGWRNLLEDKWSQWIDIYVERLKKEDISGGVDTFEQNRKKIMEGNNPKYILRNYIAQNAIDEADEGNFEEVRNLLRRLENPYNDDDGRLSEETSCGRSFKYNSLPPSSLLSLKVS